MNCYPFYYKLCLSSSAFQADSPLMEKDVVSFHSYFVWLLLSLATSIAIGVTGLVFSKYSSYVDSTESFDCGIDSLSSTRVPVCLPFFAITVVFVVFDGEMLLCLPMISCGLSMYYWWFWMMFLSLLFLGVVFELLMGTIDWKE